MTTSIKINGVSVSERVINFARHYLNTPEGNWPETLQAQENLESVLPLGLGLTALLEHVAADHQGIHPSRAKWRNLVNGGAVRLQPQDKELARPLMDRLDRRTAAEDAALREWSAEAQRLSTMIDRRISTSTTTVYGHRHALANILCLVGGGSTRRGKWSDSDVQWTKGMHGDDVWTTRAQAQTAAIMEYVKAQPVLAA